MTKALQLKSANDLLDILLSVSQSLVARSEPVWTLYYDNGTNFIGADNQMLLMNDASSKETMTLEFTLPSGDHLNCLCEAGVKSWKVNLLEFSL